MQGLALQLYTTWMFCVLVVLVDIDFFKSLAQCRFIHLRMKSSHFGFVFWQIHAIDTSSSSIPCARVDEFLTEWNSTYSIGLGIFQVLTWQRNITKNICLQKLDFVSGCFGNLKICCLLFFLISRKNSFLKST